PRAPATDSMAARAKGFRGSGMVSGRDGSRPGPAGRRLRGKTRTLLRGYLDRGPGAWFAGGSSLGELMPKTILCVDDSVTMQKVAEITFHATEYQYVGAKNADEGLAAARKERPALILADAVMPGRTGYDLCAALKADAGLKDVPVLL